jgi:hypothetical protein
MSVSALTFRQLWVVMKNHFIIALIHACLLVLLPEYVLSQTRTGLAVAATPALEGAREAAFKFGFDDLMSMLIQPRHSMD